MADHQLADRMVALDTAMITPRATAEAYVHVLFWLLPPGLWWRKDDDTTRLAHMIAGLAPELARLHNRGLDLVLEELDPRTAAELLPRWEAIFGLPDPCVPEIYQPSTLEERREALHAAWIATGGQSAGYFERVADTLLGVPEGTVEIVDLHKLPFRCSVNVCGDPLWADGSQFLFLVKAPAATSAAKQAQLECTINRIKPAHCEAEFEYSL